MGASQALWRGLAWVDGADEVARWAPDVAAHLPTPVMVADGSVGILIPQAGSLQLEIAMSVSRILDALADGVHPPDIAMWPSLAAYRPSQLSSHNSGSLALVISQAISLALTGAHPALQEHKPGLAQRLFQHVRGLERADEATRALSLMRLHDTLARGWQVLPRSPVGELVLDVLPVLFARGTLDNQPQLSMLARLLGLPGDPEAYGAAPTVLNDFVGHASAGPWRAMLDPALRQGEPLGIAEWVFRPDAPSLLRAAGALLPPDRIAGVMPLGAWDDVSTGWSMLARVLARWDIASVLAGAVRGLEIDGAGGVWTDGVPLPADDIARFRTPRQGSETFNDVLVLACAILDGHDEEVLERAAPGRLHVVGPWGLALPRDLADAADVASRWRARLLQDSPAAEPLSIGLGYGEARISLGGGPEVWQGSAVRSALAATMHLSSTQGVIMTRAEAGELARAVTRQGAEVKTQGGGFMFGRGATLLSVVPVDAQRCSLASGDAFSGSLPIEQTTEAVWTAPSGPSEDPFQTAGVLDDEQTDDDESAGVVEYRSTPLRRHTHAMPPMDLGSDIDALDSIEPDPASEVDAEDYQSLDGEAPVAAPMWLGEVLDTTPDREPLPGVPRVAAPLMLEDDDPTPNRELPPDPAHGAQDTLPSAPRPASKDWDGDSRTDPFYRGAGSPDGDVFETPPSMAKVGRAVEMPDLAFMFQGYICFTRSEGSVTFGRKYSGKVMDAHTYRTRGDLVRAYREFLLDKVREGFALRTELVTDYPSTETSYDLDIPSMERAFKELFG